MHTYLKSLMIIHMPPCACIKVSAVDTDHAAFNYICNIKRASSH